MKALGDRMKRNYEDRNKGYLTRRVPVIMRVDGKAFHTFTRGFEKPFSDKLSILMMKTATRLLEEIQGAKCAYVQSDEISILITDFDRFETEAWFDYNIQKMTSVSASIATATFNREYLANLIETIIADPDQCYAGDVSHKYHDIYETFDNEKIAYFDSRVFNIPKEDVENYFVWRQKDWERNSVSMLARSYYSHKQCENKKTADMHEMIYQAGDNWANLEDRWKNGIFISSLPFKNKEGVWSRKWVAWEECPIFVEQIAREWFQLTMEPEEY